MYIYIYVYMLAPKSQGHRFSLSSELSLSALPANGRLENAHRAICGDRYGRLFVLRSMIMILMVMIATVVALVNIIVVILIIVITRMLLTLIMVIIKCSCMCMR